MEFIITSQARLAAAQEQDRHDRLVYEEHSKREMQEHKKQTAALFERVTDLMDLQSQRMGRMDKIYQESLSQGRESLDLQKQALRLLHMILDRLPKPGHSN